MDKMFRWKTNQYAMMRIASAPAMETWHLLHLLRLLIRTVVDGTVDKILHSIPHSNMCSTYFVECCTNYIEWSNL